MEARRRTAQQLQGMVARFRLREDAAEEGVTA